VGIGKKFCFALAVVLFFFAFIEAASRLIHPVPLPPPVALANQLWIPPNERDYLLFWKMRPNSGRDGKPAISELGLREVAPPRKNPEEFRILSLGESTTFGWRVPYQHTYSQLLEKRLRSVGGRRVSVVNAGVPAYTSFQGVKYLRYHGLKLDPDAVLVYFGANDFTPLSFRTSRTGSWVENHAMTDSELFELRRSPYVRMSVFLLERSNLYRSVVLGKRVGSQEMKPLAARSRLSSQDRLEVLGEFNEICSEHGIRLVIIVPWYREFKLHEGLLRQFAEDNDVDLIDLPRLLGQAPGAREIYFMDLTHPTGRGHRLIAEAIEAALRELWTELKP
jgi:lysophospholipase L1-like esterase